MNSQDLFSRKGQVLKVDIRYDRAGRSEGVAFVTYEAIEDARAAIRDYDGANANGLFHQILRLNEIPNTRNRSTHPTNACIKPNLHCKT